TAFSAPGAFSMGLKPEDWKAKWIGDKTPPPKPAAARNGFHAEFTDKADNKKWVTIDLGQELTIDGVVLYPTRPHDFRPETPPCLPPGPPRPRSPGDFPPAGPAPRRFKNPKSPGGPPRGGRGAPRRPGQAPVRAGRGSLRTARGRRAPPRQRSRVHARPRRNA